MIQTRIIVEGSSVLFLIQKDSHIHDSYTHKDIHTPSLYSAGGDWVNTRDMKIIIILSEEIGSRDLM